MNTEIATYDYSRLPLHIITNVLSYLPVHQIINVTTVCRSWFEASLSRKISEKIAVRLYENANIGYFLEADHHVRPFAYVYFTRTNFNEFDYRKFMTRFCENIRHLQFDQCEIKFYQLLECIDKLEKLESLIIETKVYYEFNSNMDKVDCTDRLINILSGLKSLSIKCHNIETFTAANYILSRCTNLKRLTYVIPMEDSYVAELYENMIMAMDQWKRVDLNYLSIENPTSAMCDSFFTSFQMLNVVCIKKLNLRKIRTSYDPKRFNEFCAAMYDIEELHVDIKENSNLSCICKYLTNLKHLSVNAMPTKNIGIIENLHQLEVLEVTAFDVPEQELLKICNSKMPNLRKLSLNVMILNKTCLVALCNNFIKLEYLNVTLNTKYYYPIYRSLHDLIHLTIYWDDKGTDDNYDGEVSNISELKKLERLYVDVLTPGMTTEQIASLPNLKFYKCMADTYAANTD